MMETVVTETTFYPIKPTEKGLIGFCSCLIDGKISISSIAVYTTPSANIRLLFPSKKLPNSKEIQVVYPVSKPVYEAIKESVKKKIESLNEDVRKKNDITRHHFA